MKKVKANLVVKNKLVKNKHWTELKLYNSIFIGCVFRNVTFSIDFSKIKFKNCKFQSCIFEFDSEWNRIRFINCKFTNNLLFPKTFKNIYFQSNVFYKNLTNAKILKDNKFFCNVKGVQDISEITWGDTYK